jgi:hypothetical protein
MGYTMPTFVEPPPITVVATSTPIVGVMEERVLTAMRDFDAMGHQPRTGDIAAHLGIHAQSVERQALNNALTHLRHRGALRFEHEFASGVIRWRLAGTPAAV